MTLNPLAFPKGVKLTCELCQKPAFLQCILCRVTYYCCVEHQRADWLGIHEKICQTLTILRQPVPFLPSEEERQNREGEFLKQKSHMIDLTRTTGQKLLFEGKHEQAVPAAMQSLRFAIDVYGIASIELVPSYLILGEASIGMGRLSQAEEYLAQAEWTVLKTPNVSAAIKSRLHRNLGLLHAARSDFPEALRQLADDIYHASEEYGPDDIGTSGGYFHMANVFFRQGKRDVADSLYRQVTEIWHSHLDRIVRSRTRTPEPPKGVGPGAVEQEVEEEEGLDEAQEAEAIQVLNSICDMREQQPSKRSQDLVSVCHALAMLYFVLHDIKMAKEFGRKAVVASENNLDDDFSRNVVEFMKVCERVN
ncbi:zinc finger MYND domain-containing protein 12-like [Littorina saxatilis]|uniref:MYND-type domain-containing protein n=1 Tax=Littorina saxatilis TaxID=31220 RepID=A0AAN9AX92_9CAEN